MYDRGVELVFFRNHLLDISTQRGDQAVQLLPNRW
jgi:hypothetical protein